MKKYIKKYCKECEYRCSVNSKKENFSKDISVSETPKYYCRLYKIALYNYDLSFCHIKSGANIKKD